MGETFSIKQVSERTGLTEDAIRYYEKIGLLPSPKRKENGHRVYHIEDAEIMELITCLKKTGMSLENMKAYVHLPFKENIQSVPELNAMLQNYSQKITGQISELQRILRFIDDKLSRNQSLLNPDKAASKESEA
ncbi:MAG: MerR family transcriptional regulator [Paenibacillus lautus]|jgi:DNA-binding transcriptional MerR regulator|uniref:MerR family transcriptional regulator n=1 Tax=Paenibacillus lautus TaxID=1401 RepID=UPI0026EBE120|nr:MerR family transcriptional regulator [Paenibacillus lautus]MCI1774482.1 MerR family transcriptional regulator [Paenibacillus lautus]